MAINNNFSKSIPVCSGVPQGSVLGPTLFIYFINDLPTVTDSMLKIFADDTKAYSLIKSDSDVVKLQACIYTLVAWSDRWLLKFNSGKCKVIHLGKNNLKHDYHISNGNEQIILEKTTCEKDLGVFVDSELTFEEHIDNTVKKARSVSGMIMRNISYKDSEIMTPIFKTLIRPLVEYGNPVWAPYLRQKHRQD